MEEKSREGLNPWDSGRVGNGREIENHGQKRRNKEEKGGDVSRLNTVFHQGLRPSPLHVIIWEQG